MIYLFFIFLLVGAVAFHSLAMYIVAITMFVVLMALSAWVRS